MATKAELLKRAADCEQTAGNFLEQAKSLRAEAATLYEYPQEPNWSLSTIQVKHRGHLGWNYCLVYCGTRGGQWTMFDTFTGRSTVFLSWERFIDWLRDDEVIGCGDLRKLTHNGAELVVP